MKRASHAEIEASRRFMDAVLSELERQGVRKAELARRLRINRKNISMLLQGGRNFEFYTAARLAQALDRELEVWLVPKETSDGALLPCRSSAKHPWAWPTPTSDEALEGDRQRAIGHYRQTMRRLADARKNLERLGVSISEVEYLELTGAKSNSLPGDMRSLK